MYVIEDGLRQFSLSRTSEENIPLNILLKSDDDTVIGGLQGNHNAHWLYVNAVWVDSIQLAVFLCIYLLRWR